eukprot:2040564-Amphidinium_carterae.1
MEDLRPISVASVWYRLWAKWQLELMPDTMHSERNHALTGGIRQRNCYSKVLQTMLRMEIAIDAKARAHQP